MSRSYLAGSVAGAALSVVTLGSLSLMSVPAGMATGEPAVTEAPVAEAPLPAAPVSAAKAPETAIVDVPAGSEFGKPANDGAAKVPVADGAPAAAPAPAAPSAAAEPPPKLADAAPVTPAAPSTAPAPAAPVAAPEAAPAALPAADAAADAPANAPALAGAAAGNGDTNEAARIASADVQDKTAPKPAPAPEPAPEPVPAPQDEPAPAAEPAPVAKALPAPDTGAAPAPEQPIAIVPAPEPAAPAALPAPDEGAAGKPRIRRLLPAPGAEAIPDVAAAPADAGGGSSAGGAEADDGTAPEDQGVIATEKALGMPGGEVPGVKIIRVPTAQGGASADATPATLLPASPAAPEVGQPLRDYAARFSNPDARPLMAILILDRGVDQGGLDPEALAALPFPATIAIDPTRTDAGLAEGRYRAAGSEVAILATDPPEGAQASDMEVAYQAFLQALPESVAVVTEPQSAYQKTSLAAQGLAATLAADGRGLIGFAGGLNPGLRAAGRAGVPYAQVEKQFGQAEDNSGTLRHELDRAAFAAGQKGAVVIALPSTPEAITGLMAWAGSPAAATVALAPVSAVLLGQTPTALRPATGGATEPEPEPAPPETEPAP